MPDNTAAQAEMFANRLRKRYRHLLKWAKRTGTGCFRLYDRDIPEIPLVMDLYRAEDGGSNNAAVSGALYKRPYEKDEAEEDRWLAAMMEAAAQALGIDKNNIFIKTRQRQRGISQYEKNAERGFVRKTSEGGLQFLVNLSDYLDTGLFLDRRVIRNALRGESAGKRVLNLFSYTGSFSVYAADGGAASTDSVDLSNTYLDWAQENFSLNGYAAERLAEADFFAGRHQQAHRLIRADALFFLGRAANAGKCWEHIVLDPPAFSNSKKMGTDLDLQRDYVKLASRCLALLAPTGKIWFSANARSFKTGCAELETALAAFGKVKVTDPGTKAVDEDFKGRKTPRSFIIEKLS